MASYLAIQLVMTVSLLSPSMSGNVRIRWKISSGQYGVLSHRQCLAKLGSAEKYRQVNTVSLLVPAMSAYIRSAEKTQAVQDGVLPQPS